MIEAKYGHAHIEGEEDEILHEYSAITGRVLQDMLSTNRFNLDFAEKLLPEERAAASFMANLDMALIDHTSLDYEKFYDALFRLLRMKRLLK